MLGCPLGKGKAARDWARDGAVTGPDAPHVTNKKVTLQALHGCCAGVVQLLCGRCASCHTGAWEVPAREFLLSAGGGGAREIGSVTGA